MYNSHGSSMSVLFHKALSRFISLIIFLTSASLSAQNFNPPYPRLGIFTFSGYTEASADILKDFDIVTIPYYSEYGRLIKEVNPDVVLLGNTAALNNFMLGELPEPWHYHDVNGNRYPLWPGTWVMNITPSCPRVDLGDGHGPQRFIDYVLHDIEDKFDFTVFDGVFHDWWWSGPGGNVKETGDADRNGVIDKVEWGVDSVNGAWIHSLNEFHDMEYDLPGCDYVVVQIGAEFVFPHVNGVCYEDWPIYNGPWGWWRSRFSDERTKTKEPKIILLNGSMSHYHNHFPVEPYKNNYRAMRFSFCSALFVDAYYYVDEGGQIGHHGNIHFYDEFEAKGQLGYPRGNAQKLGGKPLATTPLAEGVWMRFFDHGVSIVNASGFTQTISASEIASLDPISGSRYFRILGGQDNEYNNGEEITDGNPLVLWGDVSQAKWKDPEVFGDGAMLFRNPKVLVTPIVVDNNANNQTSPGSDPVSYAGDWLMTSDGEKFYAVYHDRDYKCFEPSAFAWVNAGQGELTATYTPTIGVAGEYEVFEWHGYRDGSLGAGQATDVPVDITHAQGIAHQRINQTVHFGQWNSLGTYVFQTGKSGKVMLSNKADGVVISDAIKFEFRGLGEGYDMIPPDPPKNVKLLNGES